jgi:hypothetical protein
MTPESSEKNRMYCRIVDNNTIEVLDQKEYEREKNNISIGQTSFEYSFLSVFLKNQFDCNFFWKCKMLQGYKFSRLIENKYKIISRQKKSGLYRKHPLKEDEFIHASYFNQYIIASMIDEIGKICLQNKWEGVKIEIFNSKSESCSFKKYSLKNSYKEKMIFDKIDTNEIICQNIFFDEIFTTKINNLVAFECEYKENIFLEMNNTEYSGLESLTIRIKKLRRHRWKPCVALVTEPEGTQQ